MIRGGKGLTAAEENMLVKEAERIVSMAETWQPSAETLREVVLAVKAAGQDEHTALQREGVRRAVERGVTFGRPRKKRPKAFERCAEMIDKGEMSKVMAAKICGVSRDTFCKWLKERETERAEQAERAEMAG